MVVALCWPAAQNRLEFNKIGMDAKDALIAFATNCTALETFTYGKLQ